ncbi:MAG: putative transposase, partial [Pedobacter sp.]
MPGIVPPEVIAASTLLNGVPKGRRSLIDTIKMVAYRAETAMAHSLGEKLARTDDARALLRSIYTTEA